MNAAPSLKHRIRRLELALSDEHAETLAEIVEASYMPRPEPSRAEWATFDAECIASLTEPDIPRGRRGWLLQMIKRASGQWLANQAARAKGGEALAET